MRHDTIRFADLPYLLLHAPVLGVLKGAVLIACIRLLFPARPRPIAAPTPPVPLGPAERRLGAPLAVTLLPWATDTVHGVQPAWVGLAAACVCLLPWVGFLTGDEFAAGINVRVCLYVAGVLGLAAVVARSGLGEVLGRTLLSAMPLDPARPALGFGSLVGLTALLGVAVTAIAE